MQHSNVYTSWSAGADLEREANHSSGSLKQGSGGLYTQFECIDILLLLYHDRVCLCVH